MEESRSPSERSWRTLLYNFTQETTLHGIRFVTIKSRLPIRRTIWILLILGATAALLLLASIKLRELIANQKTVNVEVNFNDSLPFPAVTICNHNKFRISRLQEEGLLDIYSNSIGLSQEVTCNYNFTQKNLCDRPENAYFRKVIHETTRAVCKEMCASTYQQDCSGFFYDSLFRTCEMVSYTGDNDIPPPWCLQSTWEFYRRHRCLEDQVPLVCDFEDGNCDNFFLHSMLRSEVKQIDDFRGAFVDDHTFGTENLGSLLFWKASAEGTSTVTTISTQAFRSTDDECVSLFVKVNLDGNSFIRMSIKVQNEDGETTEVNFINMHREEYPDWIRLFGFLPSGTNRVVIEFYLDDPYEYEVAVIVDDLWIVPCDQIWNRDCIYSNHGTDYTGETNVTQTGTNCIEWTQEQLLNFVGSEVLTRESTFGIEKNYCRNYRFDTMFTSPWCFTGPNSWEFCTVDFCECQDGRVPSTRFNGLCVTPEVNCDGELLDSGDCVSAISLNCDFESATQCGFQPFTDGQIQWLRTKARNGDGSRSPPTDASRSADGHYLRIPSKRLLEGDQAYITLLNFQHDAPSGRVVKFQYGLPPGNEPQSGSFSIRIGDMIEKPLTAFESRASSFSILLGERSRDWREASFCLPGDMNFIMIVGTQGAENSPDIAIDNLHVTDETCQHYDNSAISPELNEKSSIPCNFSGGSSCGWYYLSASAFMTFSFVEKSLFEIAQIEGTSSFGGCNGMHYSLEGYIESPGFPNLPSKAVTCNRTLLMTEKHSIHVQFQTVDLCDGTKLTIYEDDLEMEIDPHDFFGGDFIGFERSIQYHATRLSFVFVGGHCTNGKGYRIKYSVELFDRMSQYDYQYALSYNGPHVLKPYWVILNSPATAIFEKHCLVLHIQTLKSVEVHQVGLSGTEYELMFSNKGLGPKEHVVYADVEPIGEPFFIRLSWKKQNGTSQGYIAALSSIEFVKGTCRILRAGYVEIGKVYSFNDAADTVLFSSGATRLVPVFKSLALTSYGKISECVQFEKVKDVTGGVYSNCPHIQLINHEYGGVYLEDCLAEACRLEANVVNYYRQCNGEEYCYAYLCTIKKCASVSSSNGLQYEDDHTGADVYVTSPSHINFVKVKNQNENAWPVCAKIADFPPDLKGCQEFATNGLKLQSPVLALNVNDCIIFDCLNTNNIQYTHHGDHGNYSIYLREQGNTYLRLSFKEKEPISFTILTPLINSSIGMCLSFQLRVSISNLKKTFGGLTAFMFLSSRPNQILPIHYQYDRNNVDHIIKVVLPPGEYHLNLIVKGNKYAVVELDDFAFLENLCIGNIVADFQRNPPMSFVDPLVNAPCIQTPCTPFRSNIEDDDEDDDYYYYIPPPPDNDYSSQLPDLDNRKRRQDDMSEYESNKAKHGMGFYESLSHQANDFFINCKWEEDGVDDCKNRMTQTLTDMGQCWTFNGNRDNIAYSNMTGESNGVQFWINIEQYEQMQGFDDDNGIKVHLHSQYDIPQVRSQGFSVPTSSHGLASITYTVTESLGDPYGSCMNLTLEHYRHYSRAKCENECFAKILQKQCNCTPPFFSQLGKPEQLCAIDEMFACVDVVTQGQGLSNCNCTDECIRKLYGVQLSSADITGEVPPHVDTYKLQEKVSHSYNIKHRTHSKEFQETIIQLENVQTSLNKLLKDITELLSEKDSNVYRATKTGIDLTNEKGSILKSLGNLQEFNENFNLYQSPLFDEIRSALAKGIGYLPQFQQYVISNVPQNSTEQEIVLLLNNLDVEMSSVSRGLKKSKSWTEESKKVMKMESVSLPFHLLTRECYNVLDMMEVKIDGIRIWKNDTDIKSTTWEQFYLENSNIFGSSGEIKKTIKLHKQLESCFTHYENKLKQFQILSRGVRTTNEQTEYPRIPMDKTFLQNLLSLQEDYNKVIKDYYTNKTTKSWMLKDKYFFALTTNIGNEMEELNQRISQLWLNPLMDEWGDNETDFINFVTSSLEVASALAYYFNAPYTIETDCRSWKIWRRPTLASDLTLHYELTQEETDLVWPKKTSLDRFVYHNGLVRDLVKAFYDKLKGIVVNIQASLRRHINTVLNDLSSLRQHLEQYRELTNIDKQFIRNNFLRISVFFGELKYEEIIQHPAYELSSFFSDIGGYMGLLIGASVMTIFEFLDLVIYNMLAKCFRKTGIVKREHSSTKPDDDPWQPRVVLQKQHSAKSELSNDGENGDVGKQLVTE